jgi:hypothetical protein
VDPPAASAPKENLTRRPLFWILLVLVLGACAIAIVVISLGMNQAATQTHTLVYSVTGTGPSANLSYSTVNRGNGQKGLGEAAGASLPWTKSVTASGLVTDFTLSAENGSTGTITCTISEDGKVVDTNTATGAYAIASCEVTGSS